MSGRLKSDKTAVLVIHGIGEQNPYETLDQFAGGIFSFLREKWQGIKLSLSLRKQFHKDWTEVFVRIHEEGDGPPSHYVDVYEYYWAAETQGKISFLQTLKWLLWTDLSPIRNFASNLHAMWHAGKERSWPRTIGLFFRELRRMVFYLLLAAGLIWFMVEAASVKNWNEILTPFEKIFDGQPKWVIPVGLALYGLALLMAWFLLQMLFNRVRGWGRKKRSTIRSRDSIEKAAEGVWAFTSLVLAAGFAWGGWALLDKADTSIAKIYGIFSKQGTHLLLLAAIIYPLAKYITVRFIGDVAVYVNADAKAESYEARRKILKGSCEALTRLLRNSDYGSVLLAGHSLGSVIAYDTVNRLLKEMPDAKNPAPPDHNALTDTELKRLHGLITFGSPLDKIYYFFRKHVTANQPIRAQILSWLHYFRKQRSHRDYGEYKAKLKYDQLSDSLVWMNAYSPTDPVSGYLHFYDLKDEDQTWFFYPIWGVAHMGYWDDPKFYDWWCGKLL